ncbi:helix-turn-helix domain-containing protein [Mucilaginibacter agri]|uniref:Helix-turn-helix domain-containing protein n=1 Tax=Mucilaginibacter agri TaxID=2695265 RepID=A0A965ZEE1_9SPHI|nr:AraC family transcriptional regulator [Mucilaginibacter agri]NCD69529.1 helix-turn-helix domain-containing protein [Mucilaginibacter agri]
MKVKHLMPHAKLSEYVERVLTIESGALLEPFSLALFANGMPTLLFSSAKGSLNNNIAGNITLFGQTVSPGTLLLNEPFTLIAYFFKPITLCSLFNVCGGELTNNPVDLNLIASSKITPLQDHLLNISNTDDMLLLLDNYIADLIAKAKTGYSAIQYAAHSIAHNPSKNTLAAVQKELYFSERTFQRTFEKQIGINPNLYRRICQFNAAFQQLNSRRYDKLSDIAFENGYADQSHYIRSFKEFTNITPKDYFTDTRS